MSLYFTSVSVVVLQDFDKIEQYITRCDHLPTNAVLQIAENCSEKHPYICTPGKTCKMNNTKQIKLRILKVAVTYYLGLVWFTYTYQLTGMSIFEEYFHSEQN